MTQKAKSLGDRSARSASILSYWFADLDDRSRLDPSDEPFRTCFARWYGKDPEIDREIRAAFEPDLLGVVARRAAWDEEMDAWARAPRGLLALVILLDQLPRNMYRGTARMYAHDELALSTARDAIRHYARVELPLVQRMFLYVPLMHAEDLATQHEMVRLFEALADEAARRSPGSRDFFANALGFARRHADVIERFGRFPHRNAILARISSVEEEDYLRGPDPGF
jgi:uncharacterized protein (DUF924 family)